MATARVVPSGSDRLVANISAFVDYADRSSEGMRRGLTLCVGDARALLKAIADERAELRETKAEVARLRRGDFTPEEIHDIRPHLRDVVSVDEFADACRTVMIKIYGRCPWDAGRPGVADRASGDPPEPSPNVGVSTEPCEAATGCASCHDLDAAPRATVHDSGNPWLSKLVCTSCGAAWRADYNR